MSAPVEPNTTTGKRPWLGPAVGALIVVVIVLVLFVRPSSDPDQVFKQAVGEFYGHRFAQSRVLVDRLATLRPPTATDRMLRAELEIAEGKPEAALADLATIPDDHKMAFQARLQAGQIELRRNRYVSAEAEFLNARKLDPKHAQPLRELIYIYGTQLRRAELNATFEALSKEVSLDYSQVFLWCLSRGVQWDAEELVKTLAKCIEADPNDRWARIGRAEGLRELGRLDEADATLSPLPDSDPDARATRVRLALARGDDLKAEALLGGGTTDHLGLALLRGQLALVRGDGPGALGQYRIAHRLAPHVREAVLGLGQALQMTGDAKAAAPFLAEARGFDRLGVLLQKAAVPANRDDPSLVRDLGAACAEVGRISEAKAWYNLAVQRDPLDLKAQQALARLHTAEDY